jgi:hypothetical protein
VAGRVGAGEIRPLAGCVPAPGDDTLSPTLDGSGGVPAGCYGGREEGEATMRKWTAIVAVSALACGVPGSALQDVAAAEKEAERAVAAILAGDGETQGPAVCDVLKSGIVSDVFGVAEEAGVVLGVLRACEDAPRRGARGVVATGQRRVCYATWST